MDSLPKMIHLIINNVPILLPIIVAALIYSWRTKRRLKNIRKDYSPERLERFNKGRKK